MENMGNVENQTNEEASQTLRKLEDFLMQIGAQKIRNDGKRTVYEYHNVYFGIDYENPNDRKTFFLHIAQKDIINETYQIITMLC